MLGRNGPLLTGTPLFIWMRVTCREMMTTTPPPCLVWVPSKRPAPVRPDTVPKVSKVRSEGCYSWHCPTDTFLPPWCPRLQGRYLKTQKLNICCKETCKMTLEELCCGKHPATTCPNNLNALSLKVGLSFVLQHVLRCFRAHLKGG